MPIFLVIVIVNYPTLCHTQYLRTKALQYVQENWNDCNKYCYTSRPT